MRSRKKGKTCPRCGSSDIQLLDIVDAEIHVYQCEDCDHVFEQDNFRSKSKLPRDKFDDDFEEDPEWSDYADEAQEYE